MTSSMQTGRRAVLAFTAAVLMVLVCAAPAGAAAARASLSGDGLYVTDDGAYAVYVIENDPGAVSIAKCLRDVDPAPQSVLLNGAQIPVRASGASNPVMLPVPIDISCVQKAVLDGSNALRANAGAAPVALSGVLNRAALVRATEMAVADDMSHTRPNGEEWPTVISGYGTASAENIAWMSWDLEEAGQVAMDFWEHSEVHYNNIVTPIYASMGVGCARSNTGIYYICQLFSDAQPADSSPAVTIDAVKINGTYTPNPDDFEQLPEETPSPRPSAVPGIVVASPMDPDLLVVSNVLQKDTAGDTPVITGTSAASPVAAADFLSNLSMDGMELRLTDVAGTERSGDEKIATGDHLWVSGADGFTPTGILVVVKGDVLGTGTASLSQLVRVAKAFTGQSPLDGPYLKAADTNGDGKIGLSDLVEIAKQ